MLKRLHASLAPMLDCAGTRACIAGYMLHKEKHGLLLLALAFRLLLPPQPLRPRLDHELSGCQFSLSLFHALGVRKGDNPTAA